MSDFLPVHVSNVSQSEREDFAHALAKYKRDSDEFELHEETSKRLHNGIDPSVSQLTVTLRKTGIEKIYDAGIATAWVEEFDRDLAGGFFK